MLGNLVRDIDTKEILIIDTLYVNRMYTNIKYYLDEIEGIPLDEDNIKKIKLQEKDINNESHFLLFNNLVYILDYGFITLNGNIVFEGIKYIHQLQNVYSMAGKSLNITL